MGGRDCPPQVIPVSLIEALSCVHEVDPVPLILQTDLDGAVFKEDLIQVGVILGTSVRV